MSFLRWAAILLLVCTLILVSYAVYVNVIDRAPAEVYIVNRGTAVSAVYGTVTVNPVTTLTLFSQNAGYLRTPPELASTKTIKTAQGLVVSTGQLLGTITDEVGQRLLTQAQADYDAAILHQKVGPASAPALNSAQQRLEALKRLPEGNVPKVERDAAQNDVNTLKAAVENQKLELDHVVDATARSLKATQDQQTRTNLVAPFDGVLTLAFFNEHAYVQPNQPVFTVATTATFITGQVNEEDVGLLQGGMKADLSLYFDKSKTFTATVSSILPSADANSSRYTVNLDWEHPPEDIKFGLTGEMNVIIGRRENALIMPTRALTNVDQVLIVEDGVVEQRTVKTGYKSLENVEIIEGLNEGTPVIVSDQEEFRPGQRVRPFKINTKKLKRK